MSDTQPVTRRRMREAAEANPGRHLILRCECPGAESSATPGDYFYIGEGTPFEDCEDCGCSLRLGYTRSEWVPV